MAKDPRKLDQVEGHMSVSEFFSHAAQWTSRQCGRPLTFSIATAIIVIWGVSGPFFHYSDTWQLVINTGTTIITFLMVFLIQNTQNRDSAAVQLKLAELIRVTENARNKMLTLEDMTDNELETMKDNFSEVAKRGGIGKGEVRDVEPGLNKDEKKIEKPKDHPAPSDSPDG